MEIILIILQQHLHYAFSAIIITISKTNQHTPFKTNKKHLAWMIVYKVFSWTWKNQQNACNVGVNFTTEPNFPCNIKYERLSPCCRRVAGESGRGCDLRPIIRFGRWFTRHALGFVSIIWINSCLHPSPSMTLVFANHNNWFFRSIDHVRLFGPKHGEESHQGPA